jgi:hypothetical protein
MSGPKSYSVSVFNVNLNKIFTLQAKIKNYYNELSNLKIVDEERHIKRDCTNTINETKMECEELMKPFSIGSKKEVYEDEYKRITDKVNIFINKLENLSLKLKNGIEEFNSFDKDYRAYLEYEKYIENTAMSFVRHKEQISIYLDQYLEKEYKSELTETQNIIDEIGFSFNKSPFFVGFSNNKKQKVEEVIEYLSERENDINDIRAKLSENIVSKIDIKADFSGLSSGIPLTPQFSKISLEVRKIMQKIKSLIDCIGENNIKQVYEKKLRELIDCKSLFEPFYYIQLYEEIKSSEETLRFKNIIKKEIELISDMNISMNLLAKKEFILNTSAKLLESQLISKIDFEYYKTEIEILKNENAEIIESEELIEKERLFIKQQVVNSLGEIGYEVITDVNVIDFESENDFLLSIPNQNNFLNIKFRKDGTFNYNFLIPENKTELSMDSISNKVEEMEVTCSEFKNLLREFANIGIKIDLKSEIKSSANSVITLPKKYKDLVKKRSLNRSKKKVQKRYIN